MLIRQFNDRSIVLAHSIIQLVPSNIDIMPVKFSLSDLDMTMKFIIFMFVMLSSFDFWLCFYLWFSCWFSFNFWLCLYFRFSFNFRLCFNFFLNFRFSLNFFLCFRFCLYFRFSLNFFLYLIIFCIIILYILVNISI